MALTVTHALVSAIADDPVAAAAGEVVPSDWNADHTVVIPSPFALPFATQSLEWEGADGKGFGFGFSEGVGADDNHIWNQGYNLGSIADVTEPVLFISMESNYDAGTANYMEYHLNYVPVGGGGALRPFSFDIDRATDNITARLSGEPITFSNSDGSRDPAILSFTGADNDELLLLNDLWGATGTNHYGIRYIVDATAGGTGRLLSLETSVAALFRFQSDGRLGIGPEAADQLLTVSSAGIAGFNVKTTATGTATLTFQASGSANTLVAANSSTGRLQVKMSAGVSPMLDIENKALRLGYDNYNGSTTTSIWDGTASTGVTTLAIREGAGQSTADYLSVFTGGWTVKKASINPSGIYYYGAYTDSSNYVRASLASTSTAVTLAGETAGTGADDINVMLSPAGVGRALSTTSLGITNATNGQACEIKTLTELLTIAAAATSTTTIQKPANSIILAVPVRVTTAVTCTSTFTVGDAGNATRFSTAAVSKAANTTDKGTAAGAYYNATAEGIVITPDTVPSDATGRVRVTIYYIELTPPTS